MKKHCRLTASAEADMDEAIAWYETQREGLGARFLEAVRTTLRELADNPGRGSRVPHVEDDDARRLLVEKFPYAVVYYETPTEVRVIAVAHGRRRPGYWHAETE